jgi:hypothetical protein
MSIKFSQCRAIAVPPDDKGLSPNNEFLALVAIVASRAFG